MIKNPWVKESLYFRCGFWDVQPNSMSLYHVTPRYGKIKESGAILSRKDRGDESQTLGGPHRISISSYGSLNRAFYTIIYLYRIWQIKNNLFNEKDMKKYKDLKRIDISELWKLRKENKNFTALNIIDAIRKRLNQPNPIIFSDDWALGVELNDLKIIKFNNNFSSLLIDSLYFPSSDVELRSFNQESITRLSSLSNGKSYFGLFPYDKTSLLYGDMSIYRVIEEAIHYGRDSIFYPISGYELLSNLGLDFSKCERYLISDEVIKFENITIDLRRQSIKIEDICTYNSPEQEFRIFKSVPESNFVDIYSIEDVLLIATKLNGGVEPYLWDMSFQLEESETIKSIYLSSFES